MLVAGQHIAKDGCFLKQDKEFQCMNQEFIEYEPDFLNFNSRMFPS